MKHHGKVFGGALLAVLLMLSASPSEASCSVYGKIVRLFAKASASTPYTYVYVMPQATGIKKYANYFYIGPDEATALATVTAAAAANQKVKVVGNASSCQSSGTWRYGGKVTSVHFFTLY